MERDLKRRTTHYPVVQFKKDTWEIDEFDISSIYLLIGSEKAMLIDCGIGLGDLLGTVRMLTDKELLVAVTGDQIDHTGNVCQFDEIWMNRERKEKSIPEELALRRKIVSDIALRQQGNIGSGMYGVYPLYAYNPERDLVVPEEPVPMIHPITDGMQFDLGGDRTVTAFQCPGHVTGQMMFLDSFSRSLFCGDALNYYLEIGTAPIEETIAYLEKMQELEDLYDGIYNGNHDFRAPGASLGSDCLPNALALARQIRDENCNILEVPSFKGSASGDRSHKVLQKYRNFVCYRPFDI